MSTVENESYTVQEMAKSQYKAVATWLKTKTECIDP